MKKVINAKKITEKQSIRMHFWGMLTVALIQVVKVLVLLIALLVSFMLLVYFDKWLLQVCKDHNLFYCDDISNLSLNFFQAHAAISTLSITVVSIITVLVKDRLYGIYLSKYLLFHKSKLFNNSTLIFISIFSILLNSSLIFLRLYIASSLLFVIAVAIILKLVFNTLWPFMNANLISNTLEKYFISQVRKFSGLIKVPEIIDHIAIDKLLFIYPLQRGKYNFLDTLLSDWFSDTIEKINDNKYNEYSQSVTLIPKILNAYSFDNLNYLSNGELYKFSCNAKRSIDAIINRKQDTLAWSVIIQVHHIIYKIVSESKYDRETCKRLIVYFNPYDHLMLFIDKYKSDPNTYKSIEEFIYHLVDFSMLLVAYIYYHVDDEYYQSDYAEMRMVSIFEQFAHAIDHNPYLSVTDKRKIFSLYQAYIDTFPHPQLDDVIYSSNEESNRFGMWWGRFLNARYFVETVKRNSGKYIVSEEIKSAVVHEADKIREKLYVIACEIISKTPYKE